MSNTNTNMNMDRRWLSIVPTSVQVALTVLSYVVWCWVWHWHSGDKPPAPAPSLTGGGGVPTSTTHADTVVCGDSSVRYMGGIAWVVFSYLVLVYTQIMLRPIALVKGLGFYVIAAILGQASYIAHNIGFVYFCGAAFYAACRAHDTALVVSGAVIAVMVLTLLQLIIFIVYLAIVSSASAVSLVTLQDIELQSMGGAGKEDVLLEDPHHKD